MYCLLKLTACDGLILLFLFFTTIIKLFANTTEVYMPD